MSSFSSFTPTKPNKRSHRSFGPASSAFNISSSSSSSSPSKTCPPPSSRPRSKSFLNPSASSYIPSNASLNAGAAPYIPLPASITHNISKPLPPAKKTKCPSFAYYQQLQSSDIYNATKQCLDTRSQFSSSSNLSSAASTSSYLETPVPVSFNGSVYDDSDSEIMDEFDLENIKPYIPDTELTHKHDIDLVYNLSNKSNITTISASSTSSPSATATADIINVITEDIDSKCDTFTDSDTDDDSDDGFAFDDDVHPVIAALTDKQSAELLNAPIWCPDDIDAEDEEEDEEDEEEEKVIYSKVAMDNDDYQYIIHPNKKPLKYGYMEAQQGRPSKVAMDDHIIYPPHIQYMQQYQYGGNYVIQQAGESYDEYMHQLVLSSHTTNAATTETHIDGYTDTMDIASNTTSINKIGTNTAASKIASSDNNTHSHISAMTDTKSVSSGYSIQSSIDSGVSSHDNIAPAAPCPSHKIAPPAAAYKVASEAYGYHETTSNKNLYHTIPSKVAIEGMVDSHPANTNYTSSKVAAPSNTAYNNNIASFQYNNYTNHYNPSYGESRIAQPAIPQIQYIYCRT